MSVHDVREVDANLDRRVEWVVERHLDASGGGRHGIGVASHDYEVDAIDHPVDGIADATHAGHARRSRPA